MRAARVKSCVRVFGVKVDLSEAVRSEILMRGLKQVKARYCLGKQGRGGDDEGSCIVKLRLEVF